MTGKRKNELRKMILLALVAALLLTVCAGCGKKKEPELTAEFIGSKLEPMSELVSAKLTYNGVIHYEDGNVPFFTQKAFLMVYKAEVKAGIDLSNVDITVTDTEVRVSIPEEVDVDVTVIPESLEFYTEKKALFNQDEKEDTVSAILAAEEHVMENGGIEELKESAREEAALLITGLVEALIGERTLVVLK